MADATNVQAEGIEPQQNNGFWLLIALLSHLAWGIYPVLARYLQVVSGLPTFSILAFGNLIVLVLLWRYLLRRTQVDLLKMPVLWLFIVIVVLRAVTNIASTRFTLAIYVQLITQATPFVVIFMSSVLFRESLPRFTLPAVFFSVIGAVMMIGTDFGGGSGDMIRQDWLGIGLAAFSVVMLSSYMVMIRRSVKHRVSAESLLLVQLIVIIVVCGIVSLLIGEDWTVYGRIGPMDWLVFLMFAFVVFMGANLGQIQAIQHIGAPAVSTLLSTRLGSALLFGALLLNERLESVWQIIGAAVVLVTVTVYLYLQR